MELTKFDAAVFVYNLAALFSVVFMTNQLAITDRTVELAIALGLAVFWTVYFRYGMRDRLLAAEPTSDVERVED